MALTVLLIFSLYVIFFFSALRYPIMGVLGYLSVYMSYNTNVWWGAIIAELLKRPSFVAVIFLIIGCLFNISKLEWKISRRENEFYAFLLVCWIVSLTVGQGMHPESWYYLKKFSKLFVFIFLFIRVVNTIDRYKLVIWAFILGGVFLSYQGHFIGEFSDSRLDNIGGIDFREANSFGSFLAFCVVMIGFQVLNSSWWKKFLFILCIPIMINSIIMTQSRAVTMGITAAALFTVLLAPKAYRKQIYVYLIIGAIMSASLMDPKFITRMGTIDDKIEGVYSQELVFQAENPSRIDFWKASMRIFRDHPLGIGIKNFEKMVILYDPRNPGMDPHSTYVMCYSEIGIFGILLFLLIIFEAFLQLRKVRNMLINTPHEKGTILHVFSLKIALLLYLLGIMVTHSILYSEILWILLALPICLENSAKNLLESTDKFSQENTVGDDQKTLI
jgi:O-antigen ligase